MQNTSRILLLVLAVAAVGVAGIVATFVLKRVSSHLTTEEPKVPIDTTDDGTVTWNPSTLPQGPTRRPKPVSESTAEIGKLGKLRLAGDATYKKGTFWLEREVSVLRTGSKALVDLYLTLDAKSAAGVRLRVTSKSVQLERLASASENESGRIEVLTEVDLKEPVLESGTRNAVLGALWRGGELSAWWNDRLLLTWRGKLDLTGPSAAAATEALVKLGPPRIIHPKVTSLRDSFMRETAGYTWQPRRGRWELTALSFPSRSVNPFSLRARFGDESPAEERMFRGRRRRAQYGLGVELSASEGTLRIQRITGGGAAARAGLQEEDTIVAINGRPVNHLAPWHSRQALQMFARSGVPMQLQILRVGERQIKTFNITREMFRWGTHIEGRLIEPVSDADEALVMAGEMGWTDYAAEVAVKPLGAGGMGLAIAVTSPEDFLLLRWVGAVAHGTDKAKAGTGREKVQLVRYVRGVGKVLAEKPIRYRPYEFYRLSLDWLGNRVIAQVDGNKLFEKEVKDLRRGCIALYAMRGDPVYFDDVAVDVDRSALTGTLRPRRRINRIFAHERDMERWANPALEWRRGAQSRWAVHSSRFPGEQVAVLSKPRFENLEVRLLSSENPDKDKGGYLALIVENGKAFFEGQAADGGRMTSPAAAKLRLGPIGKLVVRAGAEGASADIDGVTLNTPPDFVMEDGSMSRGNDRIAIRGLRNLGNPAIARVSSSGVLEYSFDRAPTDWKIMSGRWGLLNKWICDPRWSWFGGRSATIASIWNKYTFSGDVCVDAYVALMMRSDKPPYEQPGDFNIVLGGDGSHLNSGYSLIFAGDGNRWTRLYRDGEVVAEALAEKFRLPSDRIRQLDKPKLHQRWFHLRLEKIGNRISFYLDGQKAFSWIDPKPIAKGHVGFWTVQNGVLVARCRVASGKVMRGPLSSRRSGLYDDGAVINMYDGEIHTAVKREVLPKAVQRSLVAHAAAFQSLRSPAEPETNRSPRDDEGFRKAWRVTNGTGGASMALQWKDKYRDLSDTGAVLRFAIRVDPDVSVDLYFKNPIEGDLYRWRMTGPEESTADMPLVGQVPGVVADGKWRTVQVNLGSSWEKMWRERGRVGPPNVALRPLIGSLERHEYDIAGFRGNRVDTGYAVSDLTFYKLSQVDLDPPRVKRFVWPYDRDGDGRSLRVDFDDPGGTGVAPTRLELKLNGASVSRNLLEFDRRKQIARWDLAKWRGKRPFADGEKVIAALAPFSDRAGNMVARASTSRWTYQRSQVRVAKKPVQAPRVRVTTSTRASDLWGAQGRVPDEVGLEVGDVERLGSRRGTAVIDLEDAPEGAAAKRSVRVSALRDGARFGFRINGLAWDLASWPYLEMDYRIPSENPVNLHFVDASNNVRHALVLTDLGDATDRNARWGRHGRMGAHIGPPKGFVADGTWRHIKIPLLKMYAAAQQGLTSWKVSHLQFYDNGWRGNRKGMWYDIHSIRAVPAARSARIAFQWDSSDLTGIADYATAVDDKPDTVPTGRGIKPLETVEGAAKREYALSGKASGSTISLPRTLVPDGWKFLHVRVKNHAGIWSPTTHYRFRVDNTPPRVVRTEPPNGGKTAGKTFRVFLEEEHAIRPRSIYLRVNKQTYVVGQMGVTFDPSRNMVQFDATRTPNAGYWADGKRVSVVVGGMSDVLGNPPQAEHRFSFTVDRSLDRTGPKVSKVRFAAPEGGKGQGPDRPILMELSMALDFEETLGHVRALRDCRLDWTNDPATSGFGRRSVRAVCLEYDGDMQVMLHKNAWYMDRMPLLMFDYKTEGDIRIDLEMLVLGEWFPVQFLGEGKGAIGAIANVNRDGKWHHASVDLRRLLDERGIKLSHRIISQVRLSARGQTGCGRGAALWLDNVHLCPESGRGGQLEWEVEDDPSGIEGYSVVVDLNPRTEAPLAISDLQPLRHEGGRVGTWFVHIRAKDQADNWGPTRHFRIDF